MKETLDWFSDVTYQKSIAKDDGVEVMLYINLFYRKD